MAMRFARRLSPEFLALLQQGPLQFLVSDYSSLIPADPYAFDLQIRERDELTLYHGTTKFLTINHDAGTNSLNFSSALAYSEAMGYSELIGKRSLVNIGGLELLIRSFLVSAVTIASNRYYRNRREGFWQNRLCIAFGSHWQPGHDWLIVDREAEVAFDNREEKCTLLEPIQRKYQSIKDNLKVEDPSTWGQAVAEGGGDLGDQCDFLAIGPSDELFCIELKHGFNPSGIYWGSLQVAVYREIFTAALGQITNNIKELVHQKVALGLLPQKALSRLPQGQFRGVFPILAIAEPNDQSSCWKNLGIVMNRCPDSRTAVVEIRNHDDPAPVIRSIP